MIIIGILAAIAIPIFLSQRESPRRVDQGRPDTSRQGGRHLLGRRDGGDQPELWHIPGHVVISDGADTMTVRLTNGSAAPSHGGYTNLGDPYTWCVSLTDPDGQAQGLSVLRRGRPGTGHLLRAHCRAQLKTGRDGCRQDKIRSPRKDARCSGPNPRARTSFDGFTLIELLVVMSIAGVLMTSASSASRTGSRLRSSRAPPASSSAPCGPDPKRLFPRAGPTASTSRWHLIHPVALRVRHDDRNAGRRAVHSCRARCRSRRRTPCRQAVSCPGSSKCIYFFPRGTAVATTVDVNSSVRSRVYTVHVEGLTARVWM